MLYILCSGLEEMCVFDIMSNLLFLHILLWFCLVFECLKLQFHDTIILINCIPISTSLIRIIMSNSIRDRKGTDTAAGGGNLTFECWIHTFRQTTEDPEYLVADSALPVVYARSGIMHIRGINWQDEVRAETEGNTTLRPHARLSHNDVWENKLSL